MSELTVDAINDHLEEHDSNQDDIDDDEQPNEMPAVVIRGDEDIGKYYEIFSQGI